MTAGALLFPLMAFGQDDKKPTFPLETIYAERKKNATRKVLRNFKLSLSTGVGRTYMNHKLDSFGVFQRNGNAPRIFPVGTATDPRYSNWINKVITDTLSVQPDSFLVSGDTAKLGFKGKGFNIPLNLTLQYEFLKRFRLGGGYSYEPMFLGQFKPTYFHDKIEEFKPSDSYGWMRKFYGTAGVSFYRIDNFLFTGDLQIGNFKPGKNFDSNLIIKKGLYYNLGVTVDYELSENLRAFARPSYDFKRYTLSIPGSAPIVHKMNAAYLQFGLTYSLPELPRCYLKDCRIQINHAHGNREYRSRRHPFFKKQNPGYGENYPTLIKYKGKNKRKLNPY
ncbi:MAG: hypothetical protein IPK96_12255 [Flammeovirgaceae bacterium]|nr:hypothetical protein [Flammeovirgaceae bacterium]